MDAPTPASAALHQVRVPTVWGGAVFGELCGELCGGAGRSCVRGAGGGHAHQSPDGPGIHTPLAPDSKYRYKHRLTFPASAALDQVRVPTYCCCLLQPCCCLL